MGGAGSGAVGAGAGRAGASHIPDTEPRYFTDAVTEESLAFLRSRPADQPFFLHVNWTAPHDPWLDGNHPADLVGLYDGCDFPSIPNGDPHPWFIAEHFRQAIDNRRDALAGYGAAVTGVDRSIGAMLDELERQGVLDDTIVLFTSDNGFSCGHHGIWGKGNATWPLNLWEPSISVPFLIRWPGRIAAGREVDTAASATGIYDTLAELTGAEPSPDALRASGSFARWLMSDQTGAPQEDGLPGLPAGGRGPKPGGEAGSGPDAAQAHQPIVIYDEYGGARMIRTDGWKLVERRDGPAELYHLTEDPDEAHDLTHDPTRRAVRDDLSARLREWFAAHETAELSAWEAAVDGNGQSAPPVRTADARVRP